MVFPDFIKEVQLKSAGQQLCRVLFLLSRTRFEKEPYNRGYHINIKKVPVSTTCWSFLFNARVNLNVDEVNPSVEVKFEIELLLWTDYNRSSF